VTLPFTPSDTKTNIMKETDQISKILLPVRTALPSPRDIENTGIEKPPRPLQYYTGQINDLTAYFYYGKYLPRDVVNQCYRKGKITNVNKTDTGNGFTHSVLNTPPKFPLVKILIEPNLKVIEDKALKHKGEKYLYLHSKSFSALNDWSNTTEYIVTTTDTFRYIILPALRKNNQAKQIESITIDEVHKVPEGASFRDSLVDYYHEVSLEMLKLNPDIAIVNVTASAPLSTNPFYYWGGYDPAPCAGHNPYKIDILLTSTHTNKKEIHRNNNEGDLVDEIKNLNSQGEKVMVFTNNYRIIYQFIQNGELNATLIAGSKVARSMYYRAKVKENKNFIISTSSGFEGWDAEGEGWNVYLFSDLNESKHTIGINHTDQAIGRAREGAKKITFCEIPFYQTTDTFGNVRKLTTGFSEIEKLKERKNYRPIDLIKKKLHRNEHLKKSGEIINATAKEYELKDGINVLRPRLILEQLYADQEETERRMRSISDKIYIDQYWEFKGVKFIDVNLNAERVQKVRLKKDIGFLLDNEKLIRQKGLCDYQLTFDGETPNDLISAFEEWLIFKSLSPVTDWMSDKVRVFAEYTFRMDNEGHRVPDSSHLEAFLGSLMNDRTKDIREKVKGAESDAEKKELNDKIKRVERGWFSKNIMHLMAFILNDQKNMDANTPLNVYREYNVTTKLDTPSIEKVCNWMGVEVTELDIRSCAWRIIYAMRGMPLPDNFYGENKKNKGKLNALLNQLSAPAEVKRRKGKFEDFKRGKKKQLEYRGVPARVRNWLLDNLADKPSDEVFNTYTYHENKIIEKIIQCFPSDADIIRRHDSILVFDFDWESVTGKAVMERIKDFEYLGVKGWFL
jgi:hypothetical protein